MKIDTNTRIACPVCGNRAAKPYKEADGSWCFPTHGPDIINGDSCEASGWLIEETDIIAPRIKTTKKKTNRKKVSA